ncbi:hypothetical protein N7491_008787, partial [Penicillium cf. griseofulvum]
TTLRYLVANLVAPSYRYRRSLRFLYTQSINFESIANSKNTSYAPNLGRRYIIRLIPDRDYRNRTTIIPLPTE